MQHVTNQTISHSYRFNGKCTSVSIDAGLWHLIESHEHLLFAKNQDDREPQSTNAKSWLKITIKKICETGYQKEVTKRVKDEMLKLLIDDFYMDGYGGESSSKKYRIKLSTGFNVPSALEHALISMGGKDGLIELFNSAYKNAVTSRVEKNRTAFIARHRLLSLVIRPEMMTAARSIS